MIPIYFYANQFFDNRDLSFGINLIILTFSALSFRKLSIQAISSGFIALLGEPNFSHMNLHMFFFHWFTSFVTAAFIVTLLEKYFNEKKSTIDLINSLAKSLDSRDEYTAFHSQNVADYSKKIALEMKLPRRVCENIYYGGLLHDIGKIGIPEAVLNKPSALTDQEYDQIKQHPVIGFNLVKHIHRFKQSGILNMIQYHHERFDGTGYPHGLKGNAIPLEARIMAVADAFDAMTSRRNYRTQADWTSVLDELQQHKSTQFDPYVVDAFFNVLERDSKISSLQSKRRTIYNLNSTYSLN
ncbi:HD-GYP domain-containing protein [Bacillus sp. YZJH907-2]|uniref:HD-GYP domain-containing protein n=2 Tax=Halalkalibacter suaedae TaxID=2822140 RepID=A0A940WXT3_9BACI|nr:HD-GYP domain-containing protein [Bacillus suaedae]